MSAVARVADGRAREFAFTPKEFEWFAALVHATSGIVLGSAKSQLVYSRLAKRLRATGTSSFADYITLVESDQDEQDAAIYALTTNHTKFFREDHHFDHFAKAAWPDLAKRLAKNGRVRMWSAACSSGEEPYSLVMTALGPKRETAAPILKQDLRLLATDLSPDVLNTARAGRYPPDVFSSVPQDLRTVWMKRTTGFCEVDPACRELIAFKQLNLLRDWPMRGPFDVIFCRNVMIYFDDPTKARLQERLAGQLAPGGFIYIGHSERLLGPAERMLQPVGQTIYRKVSA